MNSLLLSILVALLIFSGCGESGNRYNYTSEQGNGSSGNTAQGPFRSISPVDAN